MRCARVLEYRLQKESLEAQGWVHSVFSRTMNLVWGERLITVLPEDVPGMPDSLRLSQEDFREVHGAAVGEPCSLRELHGVRLVIDERSVDKEGPLRLLTDAQKLYSATVRFWKAGCMGGCSAKLRRLVQAFRYGAEAEEKEKYLAMCVGYGQGLTPSSDDAVVGILAAAWAGLLSQEERVDPVRLRGLLEHRTTDVSRKYLICAAEGRFSDPIRELFQTAAQGEDLEQALEAVADVGASSGEDMLAGLHLACEAVIGGTDGRIC